MIDRSRWSRRLAAAAITLLSAGLTFLLLRLAWPIFLIPYVIAAVAVDAVVTGDAGVLTAFVIVYIVSPLVGVLFWRRPWWVRWIFTGVLLHNLAFLVWFY